MASQPTDDVAARRQEIAALSAAEYDALETSNFDKLAALPITSSTVPFRYGAALNQNGVKVNLNCTMDCKGMRQTKQGCRRDVPTRAQAAEILLESRSGKAVIWREAPIACTLLFFRSLFALPISWSVLSFPMSGTSRKCIFVYVLGVPKRAILCCFSSTS